jgi:hypothetical protein
MVSIRSLACSIILVGAFAPATLAQSPTDIYLGTLTFIDGRVQIGELRNITNRDGYDNQPSFTADGKGILYTSIRDGQADTYVYDTATGSIERVTHTAESEYSPTPMPGQQTFSVVQVEADSTQRLWHFDMSGVKRGVLLEHVKPVGYHVWYEPETVVLFVLGDPPTLQIADLSTGNADVAADAVGRSLHKVPSRPSITFVHKTSEDEWWINELDMSTRQPTKLVRTLPGREDYAWTPGGVILMGRDSEMYQWHDGRSGEWQRVADLSAQGITAITRIAVSPSGDRVAIVTERAAAGGSE